MKELRWKRKKGLLLVVVAMTSDIEKLTPRRSDLPVTCSLLVGAAKSKVISKLPDGPLNGETLLTNQFHRDTLATILLCLYPPSYKSTKHIIPLKHST